MEKEGGGWKAILQSRHIPAERRKPKLSRRMAIPIACTSWVPKLAQCQPSPERLCCLVELQRQPGQEK